MHHRVAVSLENRPRARGTCLEVERGAGLTFRHQGYVRRGWVFGSGGMDRVCVCVILWPSMQPSRYMMRWEFWMELRGKWVQKRNKMEGGYLRQRMWS